MGATLRETLVQHLNDIGIRNPADPPDQLYDDNWFHVYVGHRAVKLVPLGRAIQSLAVHDAHHLITGYGTDAAGEAALTLWELASGGCGRHWIMWLDRLLAATTFCVVFPRAAVRGFKRGRHAKNLYREDMEEALARDFEEVKRSVEGATVDAR
jgi:hypothetical protein